MKSHETRHSALRDFPVVGVGASAGELMAFKDFIGDIPSKSGMAYVFISHLSPSYISMLPEILSRETSLPVHRITTDTGLREDHIYVIPENKLLEVTDHTLKLSPRPKSAINKSIDIFFSSLAHIHKELAVGRYSRARTGTAPKVFGKLKRRAALPSPRMPPPPNGTECPAAQWKTGS